MGFDDIIRAEDKKGGRRYLMWKDLSREWQTAFELTWEAFKSGSIPIGAMITDEAGNVLITGRNQMSENKIPNYRTAHAETWCVRNLDIHKYPNFREYHLYTTMEPCPMCMGVIIMGGIRKIHVAAKDKYCGALHYLNYDPYMQSKQVQVWLEDGEMGSVQIVQQAYHEHRRYAGEDSVVFKKIAEEYPREVALGRKLYEERFLERCVEANMPYGDVYDSILNRLTEE